MVKTEKDVKPKVRTKPNIEPNKEHKQDVKHNIKLKLHILHYSAGGYLLSPRWFLT